MVRRTGEVFIPVEAVFSLFPADPRIGHFSGGVSNGVPGSQEMCDFCYKGGLTTVRPGARIFRSGLPPSPTPPMAALPFDLLAPPNPTQGYSSALPPCP